MFVKRFVDLKELNEVLKNRGIFIGSITHPDDLPNIVKKCRFSISFDDEVVELHKGEEVFNEIIEVSNLNWLLHSRGITLLHMTNEEKHLFNKFTPQFSYKLRFKVKRKGVFVPPWNLRENQMNARRMKRDPLIRKV